MDLLENEFQKINRKDINDIVNNSSIEVEEMDSLPMYILDTGFKEYDSIYGGLWQKELMMIAAPAGNEKNIYVLNIMHNILKRNERAWVIYFSPEMDRKQFLTYSLSIESGCNHETISMGSLDGLSYALLRSDALRMVTWPLILDDNIDFSIKGIAKRCLKYQKKLQKIGSGVPRVIIIDNLQLIDKNENSDDVKKTDCSVKCQKLKELAERLDATIIILYSLNESSMIRDNNRLRKKEIDQYFGKGVSENIDTLMLLCRREHCEYDWCISGKYQMEVKVVKNILGKRGKMFKLCVDTRNLRVTGKEENIMEGNCADMLPFT